MLCLADVAIGAPFGGEAQQGVVFIFPGGPGGLSTKPSQVLQPLWAAGRTPDFFGSALRGGRDLDGNGYPGKLWPLPFILECKLCDAILGSCHQRVQSPGSGL